MSCIDALVTKNDIIVYDVDAHACILLMVFVYMGKRFTYKHNDLESMEKTCNVLQKWLQKQVVVFFLQKVFWNAWTTGN
jgi:7-keto-8-aminopelargonate synthetase-like enzyme